MITYKTLPNKNVQVLLDKKLIGTIKSVEGGYQYFPKSTPKKGGKIFWALDDVKASLEDE
jgi:hypothetical protein